MIRSALSAAAAPLALCAALLTSAPVAAGQPAPALSLEQRASLRCGILFALVARDQAVGDAQALSWPAMEPRGREFFVRVMAKLMDEGALSREQANALAQETTAGLLAEPPEARGLMMPTCLTMLEVSGV